MSKPKILVTGAAGQLGQCLAKFRDEINGEFVFASKSDLDLSNSDAIREYFGTHRFDICINAGAYTKVDLAEQETQLARSINAVAPGIVANACLEQDCALIHISSDYVYHNDIRRPLREDDPVNPQSVYAQTKLAGEQHALDANPRTLVIRSSWVFSEYGTNFVLTMARLMCAGKALRIVNDQTGCPTYAGDLARAILKCAEAMHANENNEEHYGIFNFANAGPVTWYEFAEEIAKTLGIEANLTPVSTEEYNAPAPRPEYSILDCEKIQRTFGVQAPDWRVALRHLSAEGKLH